MNRDTDEVIADLRTPEQKAYDRLNFTAAALAAANRRFEEARKGYEDAALDHAEAMRTIRRLSEGKAS